MLRSRMATVLAALALLVGVTASSQASAEEMTFGTLAPKKSPWGKVFTAWAKSVKKKTKDLSGGPLELKWYFNGQQGDEKQMVGKIKSGQLSGAAVTTVGLSVAYKDIQALGMPGLFSDWKTLDKVRDQFMPEFQSAMEKNGFRLLGVGDVGLARTQSKGKPIKSPDDLKSMKVYAWSDDIIAPVTASVIGYTPVLTSVPLLLPALQQGRINVITVPPLASTQLQWWSNLDHVNDNVAGVGIGGLLASKTALDALPGDMKQILLDTGEKAGKLLTKRIRKEDDKAYDMMKERMTVVTLSDSEKNTWKAKFKEVRQRLGQGTFPADLVSRLEKAAGH